MRSHLDQNSLGWVLDLKTENFEISQPTWDRRAFVKTMDDVRLYFSKEHDVDLNKLVREQTGQEAFTMADIDHYAVVVDAVVRSFWKLPWA